MNLLALPAFNDNYIWLLHDGRDAIVVDPGDSAPVIAALAKMKLSLAGILVTHHHGDHVGGVDALRPWLKGEVFGPALENIPKPYRALNDGDRISVMGASFQVIDVPGQPQRHPSCFAATPCSRAAVVACLKARLHKCTNRSAAWHRCPATAAFAVLTNTLWPT
jgi:hydroxyacylglutathione hydrolase